MVFYKRMPSCKCLLPLLFCKDLDRNGRCFFRSYWLFKMTPWQVGCCSDTADLTLSRKSLGLGGDVVVLACHQQLKTPPCSPQLSPRKHTERRGEKIKRMFLFLALRGQGGQQLKHNPLSSVCFSNTCERTHKTRTSSRRVCTCRVL